ncbi:phosphoglycolate phosphatase [Francisellaceae bacterium]|nr:phosphoglycolate phosphatase [Francisellaceae bacterium]
MINTLLFDLDGTLVDSVPDLAAALNHMRTTLNLSTVSTGVVKNIIGKGFPNTVRAILALDLPTPEVEALHAKALKLTLDAYSECHGLSTLIYPGVIETLELLQKQDYKMAVVTNKEEAHAIALLEKINLSQYFECIIGGDSTAHYKPHPDPIFKALSELNSTSEEAVMIGDSETDIKAAQAAKIPVIAVTYGYNHGTPIQNFKPNALIDDFEQLPLALKNLQEDTKQ